ncbi:glycoside hydrolase family 32 protein [Aspergillus mulundensis]|uniref:Glycosyl hydrolase family 32 N-terminal domain-containing protein n=1 Tax=Aspergillus mulundensis TaxID=1810919 RepID=A0A3D8T615_9EURO|nr:hypothetical protein DSM5745_01203 [Aspergillus mulundensis]RDW93881.1 hypothetical protein DSM5745_01203 [Aspergillus mulundensis]
MSTPQSKPPASAFTRWRPQFHLLAPTNWLNDPCGPGYDSSTGKYHIAYQWNPKANDWGDICWGHATSRDLVSWDIDQEPCLSPSAPYDNNGIFTGCFQPTNLEGQQDGTLTYFYTSVNSLPIHYTLPYNFGCETLSIALSRDAGRTWERHPQNPILSRPPLGLQVYGWRDPYICHWLSAPENVRRAAREVAGDDVIYGFISGGLANHTPTVFVYAINRRALYQWNYIGTLLDVGLNATPSRWSGDLGLNWEVANLVTLTNNEGTSRDFLIMGVEGCIPDPKPNYPTAKDNRIQRSQLWTCIKPNGSQTSPAKALMQPSFSGIFDAGLFYAANSFFDPVSQRQVVFGWITEEDLPDDARNEQGWSGLVSLPRMLSLQTIHRVKRARATAQLHDITSIEAIPDGKGSYTVYTLGVEVDGRAQKLRGGARVATLGGLDLTLGEDEVVGKGSGSFVPLITTRWEVDASIAVGKRCGQVGMVILHDESQCLIIGPLHSLSILSD